jgi:hypothetical protein
MQPTKLREGDSASRGSWVYGASFRTILVEREMCSSLVMILKICRQNPAQVALIEDDDVIEAFAANLPNDALDVRVLPWRPRRGNDFFDAHRVNSIAEALTIRCVNVAQQIARRRVPRKGLGHLAREPGLRRVLGDIEVNDPPSIMAEDDQGVDAETSPLQRRTCRPRQCRSCGSAERCARSGGDFGAPRHVSPDRGLADFDTKLEQFAVDSGRAAKRVALWRIRSRVSELTLGRPTEHDVDRHRQYSRKPLRCHWITVAGFTSTMAFKARGQIR